MGYRPAAPHNLHTGRYVRLVHLEIARRIRAARIRADLTQGELATRVGRPQSFISKLETGEKQASFVDVLLIARALSVSIASFVPPEIKLKDK